MKTNSDDEIIADFTSLPGGGADIDEVIEALEDFDTKALEIFRQVIKRFNEMDMLGYDEKRAVDLSGNEALTSLKALIAENLPEKGDFDYLGCRKHWSDDSSSQCNCSENKEAAEVGFRDAIDQLRQRFNLNGEGKS